MFFVSRRKEAAQSDKRKLQGVLSNQIHHDYYLKGFEILSQSNDMFRKVTGYR